MTDGQGIPVIGGIQSGNHSDLYQILPHFGYDKIAKSLELWFKTISLIPINILKSTVYINLAGEEILSRTSRKMSETGNIQNVIKKRF